MQNILTQNRARAFIDSVVVLRDTATDAQASRAIGAYPMLNDNKELIRAGTRINWNGQLMRAAVDLYDTDLNTPSAAPTLWEKIDYKDGYRMIPETITAGTAFSKGEKGWWEGELYESILDANTWTPAAYPPAWAKADSK